MGGALVRLRVLNAIASSQANRGIQPSHHAHTLEMEPQECRRAFCLNYNSGTNHY
jgi:hypothetical protein